MSSVPPLGFILPEDRSREQQEAHERAMSRLRAFAMPGYVDPPVGTKILLTDFWKMPDVVADLGKPFTGFGQKTGSCFPAGTLVRMANGTEKPIESVSIGDEVITHEGRKRRVVNVMSRPYSGDLYTVTPAGFPFPLEMTSDHQVAVYREWMPDEVEWKQADELDAETDRVLVGWNREYSEQTIDTAELLGDQVIILDELMKENAYTKGNRPDVPNANFSSARGMVRNSGIDWRGRVRRRSSRVENSIFRNIAVSPSFARLIGLYLAEGGCHEGRVTFTFHAKETQFAGEVIALVRGLFGVESELETQSHRPNVLKVRIQNVNVAEVFKDLMPGNVYSKRVPGVFFNADEQTKLALILGWMDGDGYIGLKGKRGIESRIQGVTASPGLARDMVTLALSCGMKASVSKRKARKQSREAYDVYLGGKQALALFPELIAAREAANVQKRTLVVSDQVRFGYARSIRSIERRTVRDVQVYDFEVEGDHSFLAGGLAVHNCVGVSEGNAVTTVLCVQRMIADDPKKASVCFWPFPYGRTRYNEGDRGQGEGAVDSVMGDTLVKEGFFDITQPGLPTFKWDDDGLWMTGGSKVEYQWSDGAKIDPKWTSLALPQAGMTKAIVSDVVGIRAAIVNGYPILDGCNNYVGNGKIVGSGDNAYVQGHYDGRGGHSTCFLGVWNHPTDGWLYLYSNQWPTSTYPKDPAGGGRCCVWLPESQVANLFRTGGSGGETMALSHAPAFPAQPKVMNWRDYV